MKRDVDVRRMAERGENARMRVRVNIMAVVFEEAYMRKSERFEVKVDDARKRG